jgi:hypothetical protein
MLEPRTKDLEVDGIQLSIDWLTYRSYEHNRNRSPHISPESWRKIYYNAETYEKIYQSQIKNIEDFTDDYTNYRYA